MRENAAALKRRRAQRLSLPNKRLSGGWRYQTRVATYQCQSTLRSVIVVAFNLKDVKGRFARAVPEYSV